jgi:RimJ/RimL family protein N-acetyltransferase
MKTIEHIYNVDTIKAVIQPYYDQVIYDGCPSYEDFCPCMDNCLWFILFQDDLIAGLIKLDSLNFVTWIPHIVIKEEFRGKGSEEWGIMVAQYMKDRLKNVNFLVMTPYVSAKKYAERMGFKYMGIMPNSIRKNGKTMDQYMLSGFPENKAEK